MLDTVQTGTDPVSWMEEGIWTFNEPVVCRVLVMVKDMVSSMDEETVGISATMETAVRAAAEGVMLMVPEEILKPFLVISIEMLLLEVSRRQVAQISDI